MPTLKAIFNRLDTNRNGRISENEVKEAARQAGVESGMFGGLKVSKTAKAFVDAFDGNDADKDVSWSEFKGKAQSMLPENVAAAVQAGDTQLVTRSVQELMQQADASRNGKLSRNEIARTGERALAKKDVPMAGTIADIGAKMSVALLDEDGDKQISRKELENTALDAVKELATQTDS